MIPVKFLEESQGIAFVPHVPFFLYNRIVEIANNGKGAVRQAHRNKSGGHWVYSHRAMAGWGRFEETGVL